MSKKGACLFIRLQESMVLLRVHCEIGILGSNRWTVYQAMEQLQVEKSFVDHIVYMCHIGYTHYHNSNLIWRTVYCRVDEVIPSDHPRRVASMVIQWYGLIHET